MKRAIGLAAGALLGVTAAGCATVTGPAPAPSPAAAPAPPALPAPVAVAPDPAESLAAGHRQRAEALEREGALRRAQEEWKIVLTIRPGDPAARVAAARLEGRIGQETAERIKQGREALARGNGLEARRHFLAALALDPSSQVAFDALRWEVKEVRVLPHVVRKGETLATIAEQYYGDRARAEVIWELNELPPNPRLAEGTTLKIPEIPGVPFVHEKRDAPKEREAVAAAPPKTEDYGEANPILAEAREAFDRGQYPQALVDLDRVLTASPKNPEALDLQKAALYRHGKAQLDHKDDEESYRSLARLAKLDPGYQDTSSLLGQLRNRLVEKYYAQGLRFFREEKLEDAVAQWRIVLDYDPAHAGAKKNIDQAERLLRALQQRQRKQ
jgi:nucleoid-associated protein YgaU